MNKAFAIIHTFPNLRNAEYEVLQRLLSAALRIGVDTVVIDENSAVLWSSEGSPLRAGSILEESLVDFTISLHFLSARLLDTYSYITLWQPITFYHQFGYQSSIDKMTSHNDLISCDSDLADLHGMNLLSGLGRAPPEPLPKMFHTLPEPFLEPNVRTDSRLFYIGINWERLGSEKGRFHQTLAALDRHDLTDIYGPELIHGVAVWEGFKTYRGELPFDGQSVKNAINRSGVCLALSSEGHKHTGIMSNRIFEGLAGGAAIIASPNPLIDKYFKDVVYLVDDSLGEAILGQQITESLRKIRSNPEEAVRRVHEGQRILKEHCSLEASLSYLVEHTPARIQHFENQFYATASVTVILSGTFKETAALDRALNSLSKQKQSSIHLHVISDSQVCKYVNSRKNTFLVGSITSISAHAALLEPTRVTFDGPILIAERTGATVLEILASITTPLFTFVSEGEDLFSDHYATLAKSMLDMPTALFGCSGMIVSSLGADQIARRALDSARFTDLDSIVMVDGLTNPGRFVFRSELIDGQLDYLIPLLDGTEHAFFRLKAYLAGPLTQTNYATYVAHEPSVTRKPTEPFEHQQQYIRDAFARDPRWLDKLSKGVRIPEFSFAYSPGAPVRWNNANIPYNVTQTIELNKLYATRTGSEGLQYLINGFSTPEPGHVWVEGPRAIIEFALPSTSDPQEEDYDLMLRLSGRPSSETGRDQHVTFVLNGISISYQRVGPIDQDISVRLPRTITKRSKLCRLELTPDHAEQLFDQQGNMADPRRLSFRIMALNIKAESKIPLPVLKIGKTYKFDAGQDWTVGGLENFYYGEHSFTWMVGREGFIHFEIAEVVEDLAICMEMFGRPSNDGGVVQSVSISINGNESPAIIVGDEPREVYMALPRGEMLTDRFRVAIKAAHAEPVLNELGELLDGRLLGVALVSLKIVESSVNAPETSKRSPSEVDSIIADELRSSLMPERFFDVEVGQVYHVDTSTLDMLDDFYAPHSGFAWMRGPRGVLNLRIHGAQKATAFFADIVGRPPSVEGCRQTVVIEINEQRSEPVEAGDGITRVEVLIPPSSEIIAEVSVYFCAAFSEPISNADGEIADPRALSIALMRFGFEEQESMISAEDTVLLRNSNVD